MSFKILNALESTKTGRNINVNFVFSVVNTSVEIGSAYLYCVKYLLTGIL